MLLGLFKNTDGKCVGSNTDAATFSKSTNNTDTGTRINYLNQVLLTISVFSFNKLNRKNNNILYSLAPR